MPRRPTDGLVPIELDGEQHHLKWDWNAMAAIEEQTGKSLIPYRDEKGEMVLEMAQKLNRPRAGDVRLLLWACLLHENESLALREAGAYIRHDTMVRISEATFKAIMLGMGIKQDELDGKLAEAKAANGHPQLPTDLIGTNSEPSVASI